MGDYVNPQNTTSEIATIIDTTKEAVVKRFTQVTEYADDAMHTAMEFLNELQEASDPGFVIPDIEPLFPAPSSPQFNIGDPPTQPDLDLPLPDFPEEAILQSIGLLTGIQAKLEADLTAGGTGLNPAVENEIWRREEERARIALDDAKEKIAAEWSKRGFPLPDGVLTAQLTQLETEYANKRLDLSRDIAIKQYELAFQHTQFIIQQVLAMEQLVITAISEDNKSLIEEYKANIDGYKARIQSAIEKLKAYINRYEVAGTVYKAKAEAQAAIANVDIKAAEAQINTALAQMQVYVKQAELQMSSLDARARIRVAAAEAGGRIAAQLAAGAWAGVSVQAHLQAGASASKGYSGQEQVTEEYKHAEKP